MTFLNGLLAFGAAAFTIPLLIHLLHRSRFQTVDWGAMHLLQSSKNVNSRRVQWQQWLLLLLRCLLPVLLALAMSRPLFQSWLTSGDSSSVSLAIVIDDSLSMFANDASDLKKQDAQQRTQTRFEHAIQSAVEMLESLPAGSDAAVVFAGGKPESLDSHAPEALAAQLRQTAARQQPSGDLNIDQAIRDALVWLDKSSNPRRQVILASDFQANEWDSQSEARLTEVRDLIRKQSVAPELTFLQVGQALNTSGESAPGNLSVASISVTPTLIPNEREVTILSTIVNHEPTAYESVRVSVTANDFEIDRQEVTIAPKASTQIRTRWTPKQSGYNVLRVQIQREDVLMADNVRSQVAVVQPPISILLVDGDRRGEAMQSETDFLRLALSPFSLLQAEKGDLFVTKTIQPHELTEQLLESYRAVIMCNVPEVAEAQQNWLRDFAKKGNGVIFFLGDRVRVDQYQSWPTIANNGLRIANFSQRTKVATAKPEDTPATATASDAESDTANQEAGSRIRIQPIDLAPIREMSAISLGSLAKTRFEHRMPITLEPLAAAPPFNASVAMRFEDDQAWILESRLEEGRCIWISTACDDDDSNLPSRPAFVPFIQKLVAYAANLSKGDTTLNVGDEWRYELAKQTKPNQPSQAGKPSKALVYRPDGKATTVEIDERGQFVFSDTRLLGTYVVRAMPENVNESKDTKAESDSSSEILAACNVTSEPSTRKESELAGLINEDLTQLAGTWSAAVANNPKELLSASRTQWHGREIWTWLWSLLVVCFLAEIAVQQWQSPRLRGPRPATKPSTDRGARA